MRPLDLVLSRLDRPREVSPSRWRACCPAHDGTNRTTLAITEGESGAVLVRCFAGCEVEAVVRAIGLEMSDLYPPRPQQAGGGSSPIRQPFIPSQVFEVARREALVVYVVGCDMQATRELSDQSMERLVVALSRLNEIGTAAYGRR
jgi:hypothetical protein